MIQESYFTSLSLFKIEEQCLADTADVRFNYAFLFCVTRVLQCINSDQLDSTKVSFVC